jgi:hypothetical protein
MNPLPTATTGSEMGGAPWSSISIRVIVGSWNQTRTSETLSKVIPTGIRPEASGSNSQPTMPFTGPPTGLSCPPQAMFVSGSWPFGSGSPHWYRAQCRPSLVGAVQMWMGPSGVPSAKASRASLAITGTGTGPLSAFPTSSGSRATSMYASPVAKNVCTSGGAGAPWTRSRMRSPMPSAGVTSSPSASIAIAIARTNPLRLRRD